MKHAGVEVKGGIANTGVDGMGRAAAIISEQEACNIVGWVRHLLSVAIFCMSPNFLSGHCVASTVPPRHTGIPRSRSRLSRL
jgi:hypothetical protein